MTATALGRLARLLGGSSSSGRGDLQLEALARPADAGEGDLTFFLPGATPLADVRATRAVAVLVAREQARLVPRGRALIVEDVTLACARAWSWLPVRRGRSMPPCGKVDDSADVDARAAVAEGACIAARSVLEPGVIVGSEARIGADCRLGAGCVVTGRVQLGNRVHVGAGAVIGEDGFAFVRDGEKWLRMPSFGGTEIEDDVVILARTVVHAGVFGDTKIGRGCALDSQVLIGHDARLGADTAVAGHSAVAGGARLGRGCRIAGKVGIGEGVVVADGVTVTAMSLVTRSIDEPGASYSSGWPARPSAGWRRQVAVLRRMVGRAYRSGGEAGAGGA